MTPYEAVYGCPPPNLLDYMKDTSSVLDEDTLLSNRTQALQDLKINLQRAQAKMKNQADSKWSDVSFDVGDWVFLKLQPYKQISLSVHPSHKLSNGSLDRL